MNKVTDTDPGSTKSSQSSPNFEQQSIWLQSFLALFNCESVPSILFARAAQLSPRWDNSGELIHADLDCLHLIRPELLGPQLWSERFLNIEDRRRHVEELIECGDGDADELETANQRSLLTILTITAFAFPEPWCEVIWEDVEEELWEVVECTCLPLLGVLDIYDLSIILDGFVRKDAALFVLTTFFIRVSVLLAMRTPPNLLQLISQSIELFQDYARDKDDAAQKDLEYLLLSKSIAEIVVDEDHRPIAAERLLNLSHNGSMRANAAIGFALGTLPTNQIGVVSNEYSKWMPIQPYNPSTMEALVQSHLLGAISLERMSNQGLVHLSLTARVLMGFSEGRKKAYFSTARILKPLIKEIEDVYGKPSLELLLTGTTLVNSFNATKRENEGERLGRHLWLCAFGPLTESRMAGPRQQTYLMVAISDSFLGQGKYGEARQLLMDVLGHNSSDANLVMSAALRLLKMSRRERSRTLSEDWAMLGTAVRQFNKLSDALKYECIEETVCQLSVLEPDQVAKIPEASLIVKTLTNHRLTTYRGSNLSRINLHRNLEELKMFKNKLNLFSISGPQLSYCRKLRERFLPASVQVIEKVGSANWQRFKRIKEIREIEIPKEVESPMLAPAESTFLDSGIGSSLQTDFVRPLPKASRSVTSIRSFMSCEDGTMLLPPLPPATSTGERSCYICENSVQGIENESQWRRHAFSDLRPYICIVDDCNADHMNFASRAEFAAHLTEHQYTSLWTCTQCGLTEEKEHLVRDHINSTHIAGDDVNQNFDITQKSILRDLSSESCSFCGETPGAAKFVGHLCHHLEEISLSAIPQNALLDEDDRRGTSTDSSISGTRVDDIFNEFGAPFGEIHTEYTADSGILPLEEIIGAPLLSPSIVVQKFERRLEEQSERRMEDVKLQSKSDDPSQAQPLKDAVSELQSSTHTNPLVISSYWSFPEQSDFPALLRHFGTDWTGIAEHMKSKSHIMVRNYYQRHVDSGKQRGLDLERIAKRADRKRQIGETTGPLPPRTVDISMERYENPTTFHASNLQHPHPSDLTQGPPDTGSNHKRLRHEEERVPESHRNPTIARDYAPYIEDAQDVVFHKRSKFSDGGKGFSISSNSGNSAGESAFNNPIVSASAILGSTTANPQRDSKSLGLTVIARNKIHEHIFKPILANQSLKDFHPIIQDCSRKINENEIVCVRDLEKTLIFMAPDRAKTSALYLDFCLASIRCIRTMVDFSWEREQTSPNDRPYTNEYFVDIIDQVRAYAHQIQIDEGKRGMMGKLGTESTDETKLHSGLTINDRPAELVRVERNGKVISMATGKELNVEEDSQDAPRSIFCVINEDEDSEGEDDEGILRSMVRRKRNVLAAGLHPQQCPYPGCEKSFKLLFHLNKHEKTHARSWRCSHTSCKYHKYGWPTEEERNRHYSDEHSSDPLLHKCHFPSCTYESKHLPHWKQHMEKAHGWEYVRGYSELKVKGLHSASTQLPYPGDFISSGEKGADPMAAEGVDASPEARLSIPPIESSTMRQPISLEWEMMRPRIIDLYINQNMVFSEVRKALKTEFNFEPTKSQLTYRIKLWGLQKYSTKKLQVEVAEIGK